jgi:hypothetical protein
MSTLKVDAIVDKDSGNTATINGQVISASNTQGKNVVINGAMNVAQRGTSSTGLGASAGYFTVDRFSITPSATAGRLTMTQDSSAPSGFAQSIKLDCTTADTSIAAGEILLLSTQLEGQDLQRFAKGSSDAKQFAVSFYVKGNAAATYVAELYDHDNTRQVSQTFAVTSSWNRISIIFPADTTGAFDADANGSMTFQIWLHAGSTYSGGTLNTTWNSVTQANRAVGISSFFDSTDREFFITGVQIEEGPVVTDFEHRSHGQELSLCQRYYWQFGKGDPNYTPVGAGVSEGSFSNIVMVYPTKMRAAPTIAFDGIQIFDGSTLTGATSARGAYIGTRSVNQQFNHGSLVTGRGVYCSLTGTTSYLSFSSEL